MFVSVGGLNRENPEDVGWFEDGKLLPTAWVAPSRERIRPIPPGNITHCHLVARSPLAARGKRDPFESRWLRDV